MRVKAKAATSNWLRGNVLGLVAIFIALGGTAYATHPGGANTISSGDIINGEVRNGDIGNLEVRANNIAPDSLGGGKIANQSVKNADLSTGASSSNTIADGGIQGVDVKANTLTGTQIDELALDFAVLQQRVADACPAGEAIRAVAQNGTVTCEGVGAAGSFWSLSGNSGTTGTDFLGTTDSNPLNLRVNDARALRLEPASDGTNQSPNVIGGIADNAVTAGVHSATIAGGGRDTAADPATANRVTDHQGTVGGGANNQAGDADATLTDARRATVGGGRSNTASVSAATVGGGEGNTASGLRSTVGGGQQNTASVSAATVGGGDSNTAGGVAATVPGGDDNEAQGDSSLAAGRHAKANHEGAFVWADSRVFDFASTAQDQFNVRSTGGARLVSGIDGSGNPTSGLELPAGTSAWSTLVNGQPFDVRVNGARGLRIDPASDGTNQSPNVIGGIADNAVTAGVHSATIGGGGRLNPADPATANEVTDNQGTVGGGAGNQAGDGDATLTDASRATVGGGRSNTASGAQATVGGGDTNTASNSFATVGGGLENTASGTDGTVGGGFANTASGFRATVGGGFGNAASGQDATVGGGQSNTASARAATIAGGGQSDPSNAATANRVTDDYGTVGGGGNNQAGDNAGTTTDRRFATVGGGVSNTASGERSTVGGGGSNTASGGLATVGGGFDNTASGERATVGGGVSNDAQGLDATVPGGADNLAFADFSFAAGRRAFAEDQGAFVWADSENFTFQSTAQDQFRVRATGGAQFVSAIDPLDGGTDAGVQLAPGGGSWSSLSDAASKQAVEPVSGRGVLRRLDSIPVSTWSYRSQDDSTRHIGPMAQDFYRAFGVGEDRRHITSVDADGVALAAIKGLEAENDRLESRLRAERRARLKQEREFEARLAALERDGK